MPRVVLTVLPGRDSPTRRLARGALLAAYRHGIGVVATAGSARASGEPPAFPPASTTGERLRRLDDSGLAWSPRPEDADKLTEVVDVVADRERVIAAPQDAAQVAHGHAAAPPPGRAGLLVDGRGLVRVLGLTVHPADGS